VTDPEDDVGRLDGGEPQCQRIVKGVIAADAPQCVLGQDIESAAFDLGVGQLELNTLKRSEGLAELLAQADVRDGEFHGAIEHSEQCPARQHQAQRHIPGALVDAPAVDVR